jgi:hypothetical protein
MVEQEISNPRFMKSQTHPFFNVGTNKETCHTCPIDYCCLYTLFFHEKLALTRFNNKLI